MRNFLQGIYAPLNENKYVGNSKNIIYRSSLELNYFQFFDRNKNILKWGSEEIVIEYLYDIDKKIHRYFPDIIIEYLNKDKQKEKAIIELKSSNEYAESLIVYMKMYNKNINEIKKCFSLNETKDKKLFQLIKNYKPPQKITKKKKEWINQLIKNINKWKYANLFCKNNNMKFIILTEQDLNFSC